ncbi:MAG: GNAT family N-acetyltransferase, partial [Porticoccaceae bacterium]|nr:GNAT family N-acetyltransferase [Porticoccaceae bacterium]
MLNIEAFVQDRYPDFWHKRPILARPLVKILRLLCHEKEFQQFAQAYPHLRGFDFVEQVLNYFQFSYTTRDNERERIPTRGKVVIIANHPIGSLDGLALVKLIREIRPDVKVVANDILGAVDPLKPLLLPVDNMGGNTPRKNLEAIQQHLKSDGALIIFPAGEVSRLCAKGVRDGKWQPGFLRIAATCAAPIVPLFVDGRNSGFFYALSFLARPVSTLWLVREMFKHARNCVDIRIGQPISYDSYQRVNVPIREKAQLFRRHVYRIGQDKEPVLSTEAAIARPEDPLQLREEIRLCEHLGETADGKHIYLYRYQPDSTILREIGRLRELTFRAVGEGTGQRRDIDRYDPHYFQLILWDDQTLEIAGAYRFCDAAQSAEQLGEGRLYSTTLFHFEAPIHPYLTQGLELGRSFVQPKYWGKRSLDYLWFGIGAFLRRNPQYRYLFGPVSISNSYPKKAMEMLVYFYSTHFPSRELLAQARQAYTISPHRQSELAELFPGVDYKAEFSQLKNMLSHMDLSVPTLYKQYPEICDGDGVQFAAFNIDPAFGHCVDGLIIV